MAYGFLDIAMTPGVRAAQAANRSARVYTDFRGHRAFDELTAAEAEFPRFTQAELEPVLASARERIEALEAENRHLVERLRRAEANAL